MGSVRLDIEVRRGKISESRKFGEREKERKECLKPRQKIRLLLGERRKAEEQRIPTKGKKRREKEESQITKIGASRYPKTYGSPLWLLSFLFSRVVNYPWAPNHNYPPAS